MMLSLCRIGWCKTKHSAKWMDEDLHNPLGVPNDRVSVEISSRVKPEIELLFPVSFALAENVSMKDVWVTAQISKKFIVYLIPSCSF